MSAASLNRSYKRYLIRYLEELPREAHVLDIGCGTGKTIALIRSLRPDIRIAGMDIEDTSTLLPQDISFVQGRVEDLATLYPLDSFDSVLCQHVIEHLVTPMEMLLGIRAILKPGGTVFMETPNWTRLFVPFSHLWFWNDYTHVHPFSKMAFTRMFSENGFSVELLATPSSSSWFPKRQRTGSTTSGHPNEGEEGIRDPRGFGSRLLARLVNPLLHDILIGIARKR
jgi:ubiquinone/menaquinone biosynthesis C-methylase UbiE